MNDVEIKFGRVPHGLKILRQAAGFENRTGPGGFVKAPLTVEHEVCFLTPCLFRQDGVFNLDGDIVGTAPSIRFDRVANLSDTLNQTLRTGKHNRDIFISNFVGSSVNFSSIFLVFSCF